MDIHGLAAPFGVQQELECRILPRSSFFLASTVQLWFSQSSSFIFSMPLVLFISLISSALYYAGGLSPFVVVALPGKTWRNQ